MYHVSNVERTREGFVNAETKVVDTLGAARNIVAEARKDIGEVTG